MDVKFSKRLQSTFPTNRKNEEAEESLTLSLPLQVNSAEHSGRAGEATRYQPTHPRLAWKSENKCFQSGWAMDPVQRQDLTCKKHFRGFKPAKREKERPLQLF